MVPYGVKIITIVFGVNSAPFGAADSGASLAPFWGQNGRFWGRARSAVVGGLPPRGGNLTSCLFGWKKLQFGSASSGPERARIGRAAKMNEPPNPPNLTQKNNGNRTGGVGGGTAENLGRIPFIFGAHFPDFGGVFPDLWGTFPQVLGAHPTDF